MFEVLRQISFSAGWEFESLGLPLGDIYGTSLVYLKTWVFTLDRNGERSEVDG